MATSTSHLTNTPLSRRGYVTPKQNAFTFKCEFCLKEFEYKHTLKRHHAYCETKLNKRKRKLPSMKEGTNSKHRRRDIFAELSGSSSGDELEG